MICWATRAFPKAYVPICVTNLNAERRNDVWLGCKLKLQVSPLSGLAESFPIFPPLPGWATFFAPSGLSDLRHFPAPPGLGYLLLSLRAFRGRAPAGLWQRSNKKWSGGTAIRNCDAK